VLLPVLLTFGLCEHVKADEQNGGTKQADNGADNEDCLGLFTLQSVHGTFLHASVGEDEWRVSFEPGPAMERYHWNIEKVKYDSSKVSLKAIHDPPKKISAGKR
ncbi:hypothetical protein PMAYCL1PPCAC_32675, partial [Pristionchus mayeri]